MHTIIIIVAKYFIILPVIAAAIEFLRLTRNYRLKYSVHIITGGILSIVLAVIASKLIHDPRPFVVGHFTPLIMHGADNGFPSDHALLSAFLGWSILAYSHKLGTMTLTVAAMISLARMAAGVHHSWDVIGSFIIAGIAAYTTAGVVNNYFDKRHKLRVSSASRIAK